MTGCNFTEEVSLLVDGELAPREAARLRAHIEGCAACEQAREVFLLLRHELRSYERSPDPRAQGEALAAILGSRARGAESAPRETASGWRERLGGAFGGRGLRPAHVATLALLLIATMLGLRWLAGSRTPLGTRRPDAPALANTNGQPVIEEVAKDGEKKSENSNAADSPTNYKAETPEPPRPASLKPGPRERRENAQVRRDQRAQRRTREGLSHDTPQEPALASAPASQPPLTNAVAPYSARGLRAAADDPASRIGRHAERVERLLRSFRNASLTAGDPTLDAAEARRLSKRLLYSNIALRREAAGAGDRSVKGWLDSLEPILLDISNLPDRPSQDAVGSIKDRIRRRQLVGVLQAQAMLASKP
jgi:hypothetical protein